MQKALFLDRDGVVNQVVKKFSKSHNKIIDDSPFNLQELIFNKGILDIVSEARKRKYRVIIVTNQPSVLKGEFSIQDYEKITTKICEYLGLERSEIFECFHKEGISLKCRCRKPEPGLIYMAKGMFNLNLKNSIMIGDSFNDILAGKRAGLGKTIFIRRKNNELQLGNKPEEEKLVSEHLQPEFIIESLEKAISLL